MRGNKGTRPLVPTRLRCPRLVLALATAGAMLISAVQAYAQRQTPSTPAPAPAAPQAIPAFEVAERAEDLKRLLRRIERRLAASPTAQDVSQQINRRGEGLHVSALETDEMVSGRLEIFALRSPALLEGSIPRFRRMKIERNEGGLGRTWTS